MKRRLLIGLLLLVPTLGFAAGSYTEGEHYTVINPAVPTGSTDKVEVVELFWYGCPHCFQFEPYVNDWKKSKPDNVEFVRLPAIFSNPTWKLHAKAFYTAEVLDVMDKFHKPFFNAIHTDKKRMKSEEEIREFFAGIGVDNETFDETFDSFAVQTKVRRAENMTDKYGLSGVPSMAVEGKYLVDGPMAKSYGNMIKIVNFLAEKEASAKKN